MKRVSGIFVLLGIVGLALGAISIVLGYGSIAGIIWAAAALICGIGYSFLKHNKNKR